MQAPSGISAQKWVWRAMVRSALVPLVLVETVLIAAYLISNNMIRDANMAYLYQKADSELQIVTQQAAEVIHEQLLSVSRQVEIYRNEVQRVLSNDRFLISDTEKANYAVMPNGVFYSVKDIGGAASFYSSVTPPDRQDTTKVWKLSQLDPLMQQIKANNPLIAAVYFNSWDSYNRIYPWFFTPGQYPADMVIPIIIFIILQIKKTTHSAQLVGLMYILTRQGMAGWHPVLHLFIRVIFWKVLWGWILPLKPLWKKYRGCKFHGVDMRFWLIVTEILWLFLLQGKETLVLQN